MTITLFVEPESFKRFLEITQVLETLELDNTYSFQPADLVFTEKMISNWIWINMEIKEYLKLQYCIGKMSQK